MRQVLVEMRRFRGQLRSARALDGMGQANGFEHPDEIPADIGLIPAEAKARGTGVRVMVLVPVLAPGGQLERAKPPDVHAGIAFFDFLEMRQAIYQALHVERVAEADRAHPKEAHPAETENQANADREDNDRRFCPAPDFVDAAGKLGSPALFIGRLRLIEPAKMRPPEAALLRTGNVFGRVRDSVMQAMIRNPACWVAGPIEDGPEDQELLDEAVGLESLVREHPVIANRGAEPAEGDAEQSHADNLEAWHGEKNQADDGKSVNEDDISEDAFLAMNWFPEGPIPGALLLRYGQFHILSGGLLSLMRECLVCRT